MIPFMIDITASIRSLARGATAGIRGPRFQTITSILLIFGLLATFTLPSPREAGASSDEEDDETEAHRNRVVDINTRTQTILDRLTEMFTNMEEGRDHFDGPLRDAVDDGIEWAKIEIEQEREGLAEFRGEQGDCSSEACEDFRTDMLDILGNLEQLANTLVEVSPEIGVEGNVDFARLRSLIEVIPATALYPMYRATEETALFDPGFIDLLESLVDDVREVSLGVRSPEEGVGEVQTASDGTPIGCAHIMDNRQRFELRANRVSLGGSVVKNLGGVLEAVGEHTNWSKKFSLWGWAGFTIESNHVATLGGLTKIVGDLTILTGSIASDRLRFCMNHEGSCEVDIAMGDTRGHIIELYIHTSSLGKLTDPDVTRLWISDHGMTSPNASMTPVVEGVQRVELDSREVDSSTSAPLTVEVEVEQSTCSIVKVVQTPGTPSGGGQGSRP